MSIIGKVFRAINSNIRYRAIIKTQECHIHRWVSPTLRILKRRQDIYMRDKLPNPRNTYLDWNLDAELYAFGKRLNENFDSAHLLRAFTHRSYIIQEEMKQRAVGIENPDLQIKDNQEFIDEGEKFMRDYIQVYLEAALPKFPEEGIKAVRDHLMQTQLLAEVSSHLGTRDIILCGEYPVLEDTLAKTLKAIVAALIHSSDAEKAAHFVRDFVITALHGVDVNELWTIEDPAGMLRGLLKKLGMPEPEPRLLGETATNTILACYKVGIYLDKEYFSSGFGESIEIAKEMAAREGLKILFGTEENMAPMDFKIEGVPKQRMHKNIEAC